MPSVKTKNSLTTTNVPANASLLQGELAVNITDQKLWVGDGSGNPIIISDYNALGGSSVTMSTTAPSSPSDGDLWFDTERGNFNVWYVDGTSDQWVTIGGVTALSGPTVHDTPVDAATTTSISSNWAYDHENASDPHTQYVQVAGDTMTGDLHIAKSTFSTLFMKGDEYNYMRFYAGLDTTLRENGRITTNDTYIDLTKYDTSEVEKTTFRMLDTTLSFRFEGVSKLSAHVGSLYPNTDHDYNLGGAVNRFNNVYANQVILSTDATADMEAVTKQQVVLKTDVDDTPVDAATTVPISSNWAYDLINGTQSINGAWTFNDPVQIYDGYLSLNAVGLSTSQNLYLSRDAGYGATTYLRTGSVIRWGYGVDSSAESGSDAGSNFYIGRHNDAGTFQDSPFWISRATGNAVFEDELICNDDLTVSRNTQATHARIHLTRDAGSYGQIYFETVESKRWEMGINSTAEAGSDAGSDFYIGRANDSGVWQDNPIIIDRATGDVTIANELSVNGSALDDTYQPKGALTGRNYESGTTYTLVASDAGKMVECDNASAITVTVNNSVFAENDIVHIHQLGAGQVTVSAGAGVTFLKQSTFNAKTFEQYAIITLYFRSASSVLLGGSLEVA